MIHVEDIVTYAILVAIVVAFILMITGKFFDLSVERQTSVQTRATLNLLQKIVTEGPFLIEDSARNKMKLMIDRDAYTQFTNLADCCDSVQYDYKFAVGKFISSFAAETGQRFNQVDAIQPVKTNYDKTPQYTIGDFCYTNFGIGTTSGAEVPVNICSEGDPNSCEQAIAKIETTDSPLSQLSYWLTQICSSDFDVSKRIPLSPEDYAIGNDLEIVTDENGNKLVCFGNSCKRFICDKNVEPLVDPTLLNEKVPQFPNDQICHFAKIAREGGKIILYEGLGQIASPSGAEDLPKDHDVWTENGPELHFSTDSGFKITSEKIFDSANNENIEVADDAVGEKYVVMSRESGSDNVQNKPMFLNIQKVPENKNLDCDGTCVDMRTRGFDEIKFKALAYSSRPEGTIGLLTWKLYDSKNNCVQRDYGTAGVGKEEVTDKWGTYSIKLIENNIADQIYGACTGNFLGADSFPSGFDWKITKVEWNTCEKNFWLFTNTCLIGDQIKSLAIDNFYFEVAGR